jgi:hypothetical protein
LEIDLGNGTTPSMTFEALNKMLPPVMDNGDVDEPTGDVGERRAFPADNGLASVKELLLTLLLFGSNPARSVLSSTTVPQARETLSASVPFSGEPKLPMDGLLDMNRLSLMEQSSVSKSDHEERHSAVDERSTNDGEIKAWPDTNDPTLPEAPPTRHLPLNSFVKSSLPSGVLCSVCKPQNRSYDLLNKL